MKAATIENILKGNRASIVLGIYNSELNKNKKLFSQPAYYMGIHFPLSNTLQCSMHMATDFKREKADIRNNIFGLSLKYSLGGLFNQYAID